MLLGDVEELWENSVDEVLAEYPEALRLEAAFNQKGKALAVEAGLHSKPRYTRFWGNHDLAWSDRKVYQETMTPHAVGDVVAIEALRLCVHDDEGEAHEVFLAHGHQGTGNSDRYATLSKFLVRRGWRPLQKRLDQPWNTPAVDWALRGEHNEDLAAWAASNHRVLIAGHTHLPVFFNREKQPTMAPKDPTVVTSAKDGEPVEALRLARMEWDDAEHVRISRQRPPKLATPCYFNTGCCSFGDGDITGIELSDGEIRLVRWPCEPDLEPDERASLPLEEVFKLAGVRPSPCDSADSTKGRQPQVSQSALPSQERPLARFS
jgi:hypothetical protein